ncbi:MAG: leucine-rich repeat domain-containing protein [Acetobacteraceae bacterium]|jgi:serine/threonine protein kinase
MSSSTAQLHRDALAAGTVLNGYQILGVLGRGGFGITYRASDLLDQSFAIKEFFPRQFAMRSGHDVVVTSESEEAIFVDCRKRFLTEARLLSTLGRNGGTAGVVQVATFFEANNTAYSVMELLAGETLDDVLGAGVSMSPQVLSAMLRGILTPLARVHAAGFLHRDIKPSNILIRPDGQPVLIDFGSARDMRPTANTTYTQVYSGHYAPIEQMIHGAPQGPYSDIYSVGGVAYRAIGGKLIDARARQQATLSRARDPLVPAADIGRDRYPASLLLAIDRALAVAANERPQRVEEMLALLDNSFDGEATILRSRPVENRGRIGSPATRPSRRRAMSLSGVWSSVTGAFSGMGRLSQAWKRDASQQSAKPLQQQRGKSRAVVPAVIVAAAVLIGIASYVWFSGQSQPADALANLQVAVASNSSEISAKFPQTTDTAKLIAALPYLIKLKVTALDLSNSQIVTLPSLQGLGSLEKLSLRGSQVTTLLSLRGLTALRELDLSQTKLTTIPSLQDQAALQRLNLSYSGITTLPSLDGLTSLRELDLSHTNVAAMPPLEGLTELRELDLTDTNVTSLPGIQGLPKLHVTPDWLRAAPQPAPEQRPVATAPFPPESPALTTPPSPGPQAGAKPWLEPLPPLATPPVALPPAAPPTVLRPPLSRPLPTPPAPPPRIALAKPPPVKESPAQPAKPAAQAPVATPAPTEPVRRPRENEESLAGYEYFRRGYAAADSHNYAEAKSQYSLGAEKGDKNSMYSLGQLYALGLGVARDYGKALSWYKQAADHGYPTALYSIGLLYFEGGPGMAKDCTAAREWLTKAVARGVSIAQPLLNRSCY